jgi:hypothetical protein
VGKVRKAQHDALVADATVDCYDEDEHAGLSNVARSEGLEPPTF